MWYLFPLLLCDGGLLVSSQLWFRVKNLKKYWWDCNESLYCLHKIKTNILSNIVAQTFIRVVTFLVNYLYIYWMAIMS